MSTAAAAPTADRADDPFTGDHHVYEPHKAGLPPLGPYLRELWRRREFAIELARTNLRAQNFNTVFGQLWLVINPILLALVYYVLVDILRANTGGLDFFAHLMGALFVYYYVSGALRQGVKSVTSGQRLILNSAFPRALLPLSAVLIAFARFLPTIVVYVPVHIAAGLPGGIELLWIPLLLLLFTVLGTGLAMLVGALQVYFRDLKNFLPYALRMWLYASPVLYFATDVVDRGYGFLLDVNPIGRLLTAWSDVLDRGVAPSAESLLIGTAWALGLFVAGTLFFLSREREFAVRL